MEEENIDNEQDSNVDETDNMDVMLGASVPPKTPKRRKKRIASKETCWLHMMSLNR